MLFALVVGFLALLQVVLPRRFAFVPLLVACCHLGGYQLFDGLNAYRIVILVGVARAVATGVSLPPVARRGDYLFGSIAVILLVSSLGHEADQGNPFVFRAGVAINIVGAYFYGRYYIQDKGDVRRLLCTLSFCLVVLAVTMFFELVTARSFYSLLGDPTSEVGVRDGRLRASGPFAHPILAGTLGASSVALMCWLRNEHSKLALIGALASVAVSVMSGSSGPLATLILGVVLISCRRWVHYWKWVAFGASLLSIVYWLKSGAAPWFLMTKIDLVGGSTGWHRAYLIDQAIAHLSEWWLYGTEVTRHWMPTGVSWSEQHADLTNYLVHLGVISGIPIIALFLMAFWQVFKRLFRLWLSTAVDEGPMNLFTAFAITLSLHMVSFMSVSYFDQIGVVFYLTLVSSIVALSTDDARSHDLSVESDGVDDGDAVGWEQSRRAPWLT